MLLLCLLLALGGLLVGHFGWPGSDNAYRISFASEDDPCDDGGGLYFDKKSGDPLACQGRLIDRRERNVLSTAERAEAAELAKALTADGKVDDADERRLDELSKRIAHAHDQDPKPRSAEGFFAMKAGLLFAAFCLLALPIARYRDRRDQSED